MRLTVRCNGVKFRVGTDGTSTVQWLLDDIASRYEKHMRLEENSVIVRELKASDGSILGENDLVSNACDDNEELEAILALDALLPAAVSRAQATSALVGAAGTSKMPPNLTFIHRDSVSQTPATPGVVGQFEAFPKKIGSGEPTPTSRPRLVSDAYFGPVFSSAATPTQKLSSVPSTTLQAESGGSDSWGKGSVLLRNFPAHQGGVVCIEILGSGEGIVSGGRDMKVHLHNMEGVLLRSYSGHTSIVRAVRVVGDQMVSAGDGIILRGARDGANESRLTPAHAHFVSALEMDGSGTVVSASWDRTIKIWRVGGEWACTDTLAGHASAILCLSLHRDFIASGSLGGELKVWSLGSKSCTCAMVLSSSSVLAVVWVGSSTVACAVQNQIIVVDVIAKKKTHSLSGHSDLVTSLQSEGRWLLSAAKDGTIRVWDCSVTPLATHRIISAADVRCISMNSGLLAAGCETGQIFLWARTDKAELPTRDL